MFLFFLQGSFWQIQVRTWDVLCLICFDENISLVDGIHFLMYKISLEHEKRKECHTISG